VGHRDVDLSAIGPWVPEPLEPFVAIGFYSIMILGVGAAGFAGYLTRDNGPSSDDTGFKIVDVLFLAGLALFVGVAVTYLKLSWYWLVVSLALGVVIFSVPIGKRLFNRTKSDVQ
jgi:hypothetical protein